MNKLLVSFVILGVFSSIMISIIFSIYANPPPPPPLTNQQWMQSIVSSVHNKDTSSNVSFCGHDYVNSADQSYHISSKLICGYTQGNLTITRTIQTCNDLTGHCTKTNSSSIQICNGLINQCVNATGEMLKKLPLKL